MKSKYVEDRRLLKKALLEKKLVLFVGSGVSRDSGMPGWKTAVEQIADRLGIENNGNLDLLKIPQFYYNARGKKEYVELMQEIFKYGEDLDVNEIHREIVKLDIHTVVTTNYDCLLEKAFSENGEFVQVISQDRDLPYRNAEKEVIKMHGDFQADNFVLREDDYLHYSNRFKLIETYIKSLIAANTILFVGYSFSDPDVKQTFAWIKEILGEDFQRAYMLDVCNEFDQNEMNYYKNLGVNVIYASELYSDNWDKDNASQHVIKFLRSIQEAENEDDTLVEMEEDLKFYADLNYIPEECIRSVFSRSRGFSVIDGSRVQLSAGQDSLKKLLGRIFDDKCAEDVPQGKLIRSVLRKCCIARVDYQEQDGSSGSVDVSMNAPDIVMLLKSFDFEAIKLRRDANEIRLSDQTPELYMEQAYLSYCLREYIKAYLYLQRGSQLFLKRHQYVWYFLSEFNRKNLAPMILDDHMYPCEREVKEAINRECLSIDLDFIFEKLPLKGAGEKEFLRDVYTLKTYYRLFQKIYQSGRVTETQANTNYLFFSGKPAYEKMRSQICDSVLFDTCNYIMIDRYEQKLETYRLFARAMIRSICYGSQHKRTGEVDGSTQGIETGGISPADLDESDLYIIIRYMSQKELKGLLEEVCEEPLELHSGAESYLKGIVSKIPLQIGNTEAEYFWTYLTLAAYIRQDSELVEETLRRIKENVTEYTARNFAGIIQRYMGYVSRQELFDKNTLNILEEIIEALLSICQNERTVQSWNLLESCMAVYKKYRKCYSSDYLLEKGASYKLDLLARIFPYCDDKIQNMIKNLAEDQNTQTGGLTLQSYTLLVLNGCMPCNAGKEREILDSLKALKNKGIEPNPYEQRIEELANLLLEGKVCLKDEVKTAIQKSGIEFYQWLLAPDDYDYEKFKVNWLTSCSGRGLKKVAAHPRAKESIAKLICTLYQEGYRNKAVLEIYFTYFS